MYKGGAHMRKAIKSRYLVFALFYLTLLSVVILSISYSRYTSTDEHTDTAEVAVFGTDPVIFRAGDTSVISPVSCQFMPPPKSAT